MLTIEEILFLLEKGSARTGQIALLAQMAADQAILRAELYIDGHPVRVPGAPP